ncbi:hypothetical protein [Botrimarina hoheduenensis]|uniref:PEP-CTERM protein-sorting domain-containing protein n=1 Tax=Botrimarina hoheduenensis TaxID=2528000 RepID=A0A5C5WA20_9BACT|nr:hypothetical protein [Botrimarina hoheduenensis]TWT47716.1 hypothetical protein Pla111_13360 [Botrimarina hoheduenensis]
MIRLLFVLPCLLLAVPLSAATLVFDENALPTNDPVNGFGSFTFDDFGGGAVTETATSLVFDVSDNNASNGVFGGVGVDYVVENPPGSMTFVPQHFDAATHQWELRVKLLPNNAAGALRAVFIDDDGAGTADEHQYEFNLLSVPNDGEFHVLTLPLSTPLFSQGAFGFTLGNGAVDPGLRQIQIQTPFGSTGRLNVEVDYLRITPSIPEPASLGGVLISMMILGQRRRS